LGGRKPHKTACPGDAQHPIGSRRCRPGVRGCGSGHDPLDFVKRAGIIEIPKGDNERWRPVP